ncbi:VOC family protein [Rhizobium sp. VS19-DR104.2]|uniref:VOC family protein n=1 Tax=unclassified Rhizobium TaxID=2613769 RepID=UPI001C5AE73E|nr:MULTISPECIES: VOC family protein [unclassified Rhizobium]MBZ5762102.1 VOC family protein [Rhizobium sp. VS19-DR96]MBZ5768215.1 VOC family protein [Rhizobium sp. VS19-DR129.2]MBZ5775720.1 VOC family protein [Rhizobium sp. VS19-DRK62.2]MBZ5786979.1 VOC family protein [Rhizobium sp. VS19-DR121]MBZ5804140.1 VOC family protein [Rhizobium sp. VS19-DR181]
MISIEGLYETHLTVSDLGRSINFYQNIVGLELAHTIPERNVAFLWIGGRERSMLGLWSIQSSPLRMKLHIAFRTTIDQVTKAPAYLRSKGIVPRNGAGDEIREPIVFPWMPAASVYFNDPDEHSLEYIAILPRQARADIPGITTLSEWNRPRDDKG